MVPTPPLPTGQVSHANTLTDVTRENIEMILASEHKARLAKPKVYRAVIALASFCGTLSFLGLHVLVFSGWLLANQSPKALDAYPHPFLILVLALETIFLSLLILIGQKMSSDQEARRHHLDLQINLLNEREMTTLLRLNARIAKHLGLADELFGDLHAFTDPTDPQKMFDQIVQAEEKLRN